MIKLINFVASILFPICIGFLSSLITVDSVSNYGDFVKPFLSPPSYVFGPVWSILYALMGISAFIVWEKTKLNWLYVWTSTFYIPQLVVNFFWSIFFFSLDWKLFAFIWLLLLFVLVCFMIIRFMSISKFAGYLQIPYLLWLCFAGYLNISIYILNS